MICSSACIRQPGISSKCSNRGMSTYMESDIRQKFLCLSLSNFQSSRKVTAYLMVNIGKWIKVKFKKSYKNLLV